MKKNNKLKLAGALLGATLITATAGVASDMKKSGDEMSKSESMMKDNNMTSAEMMKKKKEMQELAKAADKKHAVSKWG